MRSVSRHFAILLALPLLAGGCSHPSGLGQLAGMASSKPSPELATGLRIAEATRNGGDNQAAIALYRQIVAANPTSPLPLLGLGDALYEGRAFDEAIAAYQAALRLDAGNPDAQVGIGRVDLARNLPADALAAFDGALAKAPQHAAALNGKGVALDLMGRPEEARILYRQVLALQPGNRGARNNLALSLLLAGDKDQAISQFQELSTERSAGQPRIRQNLALALGMAGRMDAAAEVAKMDLGPEAVKENLAYYAMLRSLDGQSDRHAALARAVTAGGS
ncbi:tetratricopeptide repeat protein [Azospirillum sp. B506]|uniref:tetratricopeptide repeat protein n=1 Tax=Azospirillum sp. B506 TaxID=137721 RepID=UPI00034ADD25|nr:tetratricopeptide repeat protein [Azospirillum sp. B506]